jgi:hypothetical protein
MVPVVRSGGVGVSGAAFVTGADVVEVDGSGSGCWLKEDADGGCGSCWSELVGGALTMGRSSIGGMGDPGETLGSFGPDGGALSGAVVGW